jgi:hypothetical protein
MVIAAVLGIVAGAGPAELADWFMLGERLVHG